MSNTRHKQAATVTLELLAERWPRCFAIFEQRRRPLKLGIDQDIAAALADPFTPDELKSALRFYVGNIGYLLACREGAERVDLDGNVVGAVTAAEAAHAARVIARRQNKTAKPINKQPKPGFRLPIFAKPRSGGRRRREQHRPYFYLGPPRHSAATNRAERAVGFHYHLQGRARHRRSDQSPTQCSKNCPAQLRLALRQCPRN